MTEHFPQEAAHPRKRMGRTHLEGSGAHSWGCQSSPCHGKHPYKPLFLPTPECSDTKGELEVLAESRTRVTW